MPKLTKVSLVAAPILIGVAAFVWQDRNKEKASEVEASGEWWRVSRPSRTSSALPDASR